MSKQMNPYGVGYSGDTVAEYPLECPCCRTEFIWKGPPGARYDGHRCGPCREHSDATVEDELVKLREHDQRLPGLVDKAREITRSAMRKVTEAKDEIRDKNGQVAAALQSRDKWREQLNAVTAEHYGIENSNVCACGVKECNVEQLLEAVRGRQRDRYGW